MPQRWCHFWVRHSGVQNKANTGVRWVHITTRFETSQNRPRPKRINTERDESSQTHLAVFTTLRSFRDNVLSVGLHTAPARLHFRTQRTAHLFVCGTSQ